MDWGRRGLLVGSMTHIRSRKGPGFAQNATIAPPSGYNAKDTRIAELGRRRA